MVGVLVGLGTLGCKTPPPAVEPPGDASLAPVIPPTPASAPDDVFVVLRRQHTLVIPVDPSREAVELPGHWVGALPLTEAGGFGHMEIELTAAADPDAPTIPVCPSGAFGDPCELRVDLDGSHPFAALGSASAMLRLDVQHTLGRDPSFTLFDPWHEAACSCVVVEGISTDGARTPEFDLGDPEVLDAIALSPYSPEEYEDNCSEEAMQPELEDSGFVGGMLYRTGMASTNVCNGLNLYDGAYETVALRPGASTIEGLAAEQWCEGTSMGSIGHAAISALDDGTPPEDDEGCSPEYADEMVATSIVRGHLVRAGGSVNGVGEECACASVVPLGLDECPSPLDPCGTAEGFSGLDLEQAEGWWVDSDGRHALVADGEGLTIFAHDDPEPRRRVLGSGAIVGVEYHPHAALLDVPSVPTELRPALPSPHEDDEDLDGSAREWGNRCFVHLREGRLDAAEAACFAGLLVGGTDGTRGALTYNLGRIEEARGDVERAREYYQRSDGLRPGNATVRERLQALGGP